LTRYKEEIFYNEGGEIVEWVAQTGGRCPTSGNIQGQVAFSYRSYREKFLQGTFLFFCISEMPTDVLY